MLFVDILILFITQKFRSGGAVLARVPYASNRGSFLPKNSLARIRTVLLLLN